MVEPPLPSEIHDLHPQFAGKRVLVVDQDVSSLLLLTPLLEQRGLKVSAAGDEREALDVLAEEEPFDLVLIDAMVPEMDACETIAIIRTEDHARSLPIIVLVSDLASGEGQRCLAAGANEAIAKPVKPAELERLLLRHLGPAESGEVRKAQP
jgi:CheY-like chemotaxis protein